MVRMEGALYLVSKKMGQTDRQMDGQTQDRYITFRWTRPAQ